LREVNLGRAMVQTFSSAVFGIEELLSIFLKKKTLLTGGIPMPWRLRQGKYSGILGHHRNINRIRISHLLKVVAFVA
jgi:hypothetical protein